MTIKPVNQITYPGFRTYIDRPTQGFYSIACKICVVVTGMLLINKKCGNSSNRLHQIVRFANIMTSCLLFANISRLCSRRPSYCLRSDTHSPAQTPTEIAITPPLGTFSRTCIRVSNHCRESFEWKKRLIMSAEASIELSPNFAGGVSFRAILDLIHAQMQKKPTLRVHLLLSPDLLEPADRIALQALAKNERFYYLITGRLLHLYPSPCLQENHVKLLIVDGKYFVVGGSGINHRMISEDYVPIKQFRREPLSSRCIDQTFRDTDIIGAGPAARTMRVQFYRLLSKWIHRMQAIECDRYFSLPSETSSICETFHETEGLIHDAPLKVVVGGPEHRQDNPITREIAHHITLATRIIRIGNLLFNPMGAIKRALESKKALGVHISGCFNGITPHTSLLHYLLVLPARANYCLLNTAYEYQMRSQMYHKKVATFDGRYTLIGSYNWDFRSDACDDEILLVVDSEQVTRCVDSGLDTDAQRSVRKTEADISSTHRVMGRNLGAITRFFI